MNEHFENLFLEFLNIYNIDEMANFLDSHPEFISELHDTSEYIEVTPTKIAWEQLKQLLKNEETQQDEQKNRYRIEYEFDLLIDDNELNTRQDYVDCIEEDAEEAITKAISNIIEMPRDAKKTAYRVVKL